MARRNGGFALRVNELHKSFNVSESRSTSIKHIFTSIGRKDNREEIKTRQKVLDGISFEIKKGEFFGIVGRNGSGKSTLLKILAGVYSPDSGLAEVNGSLTPFIELGVGFNPELTGRDNVYLSASLLGFNRKQIGEMYEGIVDFAELHDHMDKKLKNYSSGMQVRLAFSISIQSNSDILLLDEVLAVGDEAFQRKCYEYFAELKRNNKTVVLVTHSMDSVQQFCTSAILINDGVIIESGSTASVASKYLELNSEPQTVLNNKTDEKVGNDHGIKIKTDLTKGTDNLKFDIEVNSKVYISDAVITFLIIRDDGETVYRWVTDSNIEGKLELLKNSTTKINLVIQNIFPDGKYDVQVAVKKPDRSVVYALYNRVITYRLLNADTKKRNSNWKPVESFTYEQY